MFVPVIPIVPRTTVINKTIVYSDTVLSLKDIGNNLKVTSISDVSEYSLESCLKTVFESNPDVVFNTVQYSKNDKKVYFYTDKEISIKEYLDSKKIKYEPLSSSTQILEEIKNILISEKIKDNGCVSLYDVSNLIKEVNTEYKKIKDKDNELKNKLSNRFGSIGFIIHDFDYNKNELVIEFKYLDRWDKIKFTKNKGDLFITESDSYHANDILVTIGEDLSKIYDEFLKFEKFNKQYNYGFNSVNSRFLINVSQCGTSIYVRNQSNRFKSDFELTSYSYNDVYDYECNSNNVISAIKDNEDEIFKRIFVRIDDCPEWSRQMLYEIRKNQLEEELVIVEKEKKKQKRLELVKKIFPFLNK